MKISCLLRVSIKRKPLAELLSATRLPYFGAYDKSTLARFGSRKGKPLGYSGFSCRASVKEWDDFPGQVADAIKFLRRHRAALQKLRDEFDGLEIQLDFPYFLRIGTKNICVQWDSLPPALISLAGELGVGIMMSLYPSRRSARQWAKINDYAAGRIPVSCRAG